MCRACDDPSYTQDDHLEWLVETIEHFGWAIQYVEPDERRPPFAYTVGLTDLDLPELVVTGICSSDAAALLNVSAADLASGSIRRPGDRWQPIGFPPLEAVSVTTPDAHLLGACELYGTWVEGLQLAYADRHGVWPWEPGYEAHAGIQYLLGPRTDSKTVGDHL